LVIYVFYRIMKGKDSEFYGWSISFITLSVLNSIFFTKFGFL
jgi:hypothetical protein